jgi:hypothetical protein
VKNPLTPDDTQEMFAGSMRKSHEDSMNNENAVACRLTDAADAVRH